MNGSPNQRPSVVPVSRFVFRVLILLMVLPGWAPAQHVSNTFQSRSGSATGTTRFWVILRSRPQLEAASAIADYAARGQFVFDELHRNAAASQGPLISFLEQRNAKVRSFWIANTVWVEADEVTRKLVAGLPEVEAIVPDEPIVMDDPPARISPRPKPQAVNETLNIEWNVVRTRAPEVWTQFGGEGQGIVVGILDTGFAHHPAISGRYRGTIGTNTYNNNHNWFDPISNDRCRTAPCDDNGHGTHVTGTVLGRAGTDDFGVAPLAKFISCKAFRASGAASMEDILSCYQWFLAPTDLAGNNANPALRPQIINQSFGGATGATLFTKASEDLQGAGILSVAAAGNSGQACGTVSFPAAISNVLAVGALAFESSTIANFSSAGPSASNRYLIKPDVVAGGGNVTSAWLNNQYRTISGTSMASPAVAGVAAVVMSAAPEWINHPAALADLLRRTAKKIDISSSNTCKVVTGSPNMVFGYGEIDAYQAAEEARNSHP
jgi:subtilisin family serine protease